MKIREILINICELNLSQIQSIYEMYDTYKLSSYTESEDFRYTINANIIKLVDNINKSKIYMNRVYNSLIEFKYDKSMTLLEYAVAFEEVLDMQKGIINEYVINSNIIKPSDMKPYIKESYNYLDHKKPVTNKDYMCESKRINIFKVMLINPVNHAMRVLPHL